MIRLGALHGTGDCYMTLAFAKAVEVAQNEEVCVAIKPQHRALASMFPDVQLAVDPYLAQMELDNWAQHQVNDWHKETFYVHPSFVNSGVRIDHLALLPRPLTHADLWRAMLKLPPETPMVRGKYEHRITRMPRRVFIIPTARSWPNSNPEFWVHLRRQLDISGWDVRMNEDGEGLYWLLQECSEAEWVIGPQCGVMAILCHAMFPCRKTIVTPSVDGSSYYGFTYPYAYVTKFAGEDYDDVEEIKLADNILGVINETLAGRHAQQLPVAHSRVFTTDIGLSAGELLDRFSILELKVNRLPVEQRAYVMREYFKYREAAQRLFIETPKLGDAFARLMICNADAWKHNEISVTDMLQRNVELSEHFSKAARLNKQRIELKNEINHMCSSAFMEIKSYYA